MGQGRAIDEALRQQMSSELKAMEEGIHSALMGLSASAGGAVAVAAGGRGEETVAGSTPLRLGGVAAGDVGFAEVWTV